MRALRKPKSPPVLAQRLKLAVRAAGGNRLIAQVIGISEAQLYRYFTGTPVPSDKLMAIARACHVKIAWLFPGH